MLSDSKFEEIKRGGNLPSPKGVALQVIRLLQQDGASNQDVANAIKSDPVLSSRVIQASNALVAYQSRPIASVIDAVTVLGFNAIKKLTLSLSLLENNRDGACRNFDYQGFWANSLLTAIVAQNLLLHNSIGSSEEIFMLGLLGQVGALALATVYPGEYSDLIDKQERNPQSGMVAYERSKFGFDHNQLTQAMLADWGMPRVFQDIVLHHEEPSLSGFAEDSRNWRLLNILHIAAYFARVCLARETQRRKMLPKLLLLSTRLGIETEVLAKLGDKSVKDWLKWSEIFGVRSVDVFQLSESFAAEALLPSMVDVEDEFPVSSGTFYKLRILIVDDDRTVLFLLKTWLTKAGHSVATAGNGRDGLGLIEVFKPQLIIADWMMPEMDGIEFCRQLRENRAWRNIYVVIMTAQEGVERLVEAFEAGANDYLSKPISSKVLMARLRAGQRVVQLQDEVEFDKYQMQRFSDELAMTNQRFRKSDLRMRAILENSPYMVWLKESDGRYIKVNQSYVRFMQHTDAKQVVGKTDFDLLPGALAERHSMLDDEVIASRQPKHAEEVIFENGKNRWLETVRTPIVDVNGKVLGITGFSRDISEDKKVEEELRIAAIAFEASEAMMITDVNQVILRVNHAFSEMTGYASEDVVGRTPGILQSGYQDAEFYSVMWDSLRLNGSWQGEILDRRKNGEVYPAQLMISSVKAENGEVTHYVGMLSDITLRKQSEEQIHMLAFYDTLTKLPNRRLLYDRLSQVMVQSRRSGCYGAVIFLDLDNFKPLNDIYGHVVGDLLLVEAAKRLGACVRESDTVARFGGDEFVVILSELNSDKGESAMQAGIVAEKIRASLAAPYKLTLPVGDGQTVVEHSCTSSIGVALILDCEASPDDVIKWADIAMYQAKKVGRNSICFH